MTNAACAEIGANEDGTYDSREDESFPSGIPDDENYTDEVYAIDLTPPWALVPITTATVGGVGSVVKVVPSVEYLKYRNFIAANEKKREA